MLEELFAQHDTAIPEKLMARAYGIVVVPNVVKVAAVVGGRRGSGAMVVRDANGKFTDPIMVSLTGGNVGWQIGVQSTDIVLVFTTPEEHRGHHRRQAHARRRRVGGSRTRRPLRIGGDRPELHRRGLFVLAQSRAVRRRVTRRQHPAIDTKSNKGLYGKSAPAADIIAGNITTDADAANRFERAILASTAGRTAAPATASNAHSTPAAPAAPAPPAEAGAPPAEGIAHGRRAARRRTSALNNHREIVRRRAGGLSAGAEARGSLHNPLY